MSTCGVYFDHRLTERLREEAPGAYKDIGEVMRAQRDLTRIVCATGDLGDKSFWTPR